jgi:polysaccharide export outer membrane protein
MQKNLIVFLLTLGLLSSCVNSKRATYFINLKDSSAFNEVEAPEHIIEKNDILSISVNSINAEASKTFNMPNHSEVRSTTSTEVVLEPGGYLVSRDGTIRFLMVGDIIAEGLTKEQLGTNIRNVILERKLLLDHVVEIRHLNFRVTVLGEVARPTVITVPNEKISLLEALGIAGDLTIYGERNNVLVIRTEEGKRIGRRINLNSNELLISPDFFLKANDVVYVEPNKAKVMSGHA